MLEGRAEIREITDNSEHKKDSGQRGGGEKGGTELRGGAKELKQETRKEFKHLVFHASVR